MDFNTAHCWNISFPRFQDKSWTYNISSNFLNGSDRSYFAFFTSVTAENTIDAIKEIQKEISDARTVRPITDEEVAKVTKEQAMQLIGITRAIRIWLPFMSIAT